MLATLAKTWRDALTLDSQTIYFIFLFFIPFFYTFQIGSRSRLNVNYQETRSTSKFLTNLIFYYNIIFIWCWTPVRSWSARRLISLIKPAKWTSKSSMMKGQYIYLQIRIVHAIKDGTVWAESNDLLAWVYFFKNLADCPGALTSGWPIVTLTFVCITRQNVMLFTP